MNRVSDVTRILDAAQSGDPTAAEQLLPLVYEELRKLATSRMVNEAAGHTLQPTALVHEAWLRLVGTCNPEADALRQEVADLKARLKASSTSRQ